MARTKFKAEVLTPEGQVFDDEVEMVSTPTGAVFANLGLLAVLTASKMVPKLGLVFPLARRADRQHAPFISLLMSTGLTFGTISSLYGLKRGDHRPDPVLAAGHRGRSVG